MARGKAHDPEVKAAVMAALLTGQGVTEVASRHKLDPSVVSRWKSTIPETKLQEVATEKKECFDSLIADYLAANLKTLKVQAEVAGEPDYIRKQTAERLAVLHGVIADKGIRLLEAAAAGQQEENDGEE